MKKKNEKFCMYKLINYKKKKENKSEKNELNVRADYYKPIEKCLR